MAFQFPPKSGAPKPGMNAPKPGKADQLAAILKGLKK